MPATWAVKVAVAFINIMMKHKVLILLLLMALGFFACEEEDPQANFPYVTVELEINLQDLRYQNLHTGGGWIYLNGGLGGLILIKEGNNQYRAFDRACPYHPRESCALVEMHSSGFYLIDNCCGSQFDKSGNVTTGPANQPLMQYPTYQSGNFLSIRN